MFCLCVHLTLSVSGVAVGMYTTYISGPCSPTVNTIHSGCYFVIENSRSSVVVVENQEQLDLMLEV